MSAGRCQFDLLSKAASGDRFALSEALLRHYEELQQHIEYRLRGDLQRHVSADDVLQQTMVRAARGIHGFEPRHENAFLGWLKTIADNLIRDAHKKKRRERRAEGRDGAGQDSSWVAMVERIAEEGSTPSVKVQRQDGARRLRAAMASLPEDYREVVERYYLLDQSLEEIAQAVGATRGSVRAMCYRARKRLRELMGRSSMYFSK